MTLTLRHLTHALKLRLVLNLKIVAALFQELFEAWEWMRQGAA